MTNTKTSAASYLSFEQSIFITLVPAVFFLLNGLIVNILKTLEASTIFYVFLPITFLLVMFESNRKYQFFTKKNVYKFLPVLILPILFSALHFLQYGTSYGGDSASYFTNPMYTFYESGNFSHSEKPFISYGEQPLASYWLPYNAEFIFTAIGSIFNLQFIQVAGLMHVTSNYLFSFAILCILLRFIQFLHAAIVFLIFLILLYGTHGATYDLAANSAFRGFENKGLIWGYFLWASISLFFPYAYDAKQPKLMFLSGLLLGASSFLVSGNAAFLLFPVTVLVIGALIGLNWKAVIFQFIGFLASLLFCITIFKLLETTNVYEVVTADLTFRSPDKYETQYAGFKSPLWLWGLAVVLTVLVGLSNLKLSIQLLVFIVISQLIQSEKFFDLFFVFAPEFTLNFWRLAVLMTPFLPVLLAASYLLSTQSFTKHTIGFTTIGVILIAAIAFEALKVPQTSPFRQNTIRPHFLALAELCKPNSIILADRSLGTRLPVLQPSYQYLVGKEYFLNWQIANLVDQPTDKERALYIRDASLYLSKSPTTKSFGEDPDGLIKTIANEKPDAIFMPTKRLTPENEYLFSSYTKQIYRGVTAYTNNDNCRTDFKELVNHMKGLQE